MKRISFYLIAALVAILNVGLLNNLYAQQVMRFEAGEDTALLLEFRVMAKDKEGKLMVDTLLPMPGGGEASLNVGDVVVSLNGKAIKTAKDWRTHYATISDKAKLTLVVSRNGTNRTVTAEKTAIEAGGRQVITAGPDGQQGAFTFTRGANAENMKVSKHLHGIVFLDKDGVIKVEGIMNEGKEGATTSALKSGDVVLGLNGTFLKTFAELEAQLEKTQAGDDLRFAVERNGERQFVTMKKPASK